MVFGDAQTAKEYLVKTIADAAVRAGQPLSANDLAMLRFSEIHGPVRETTELPVDEEDWEARVAGLIKYARAGVRASGQLDDWNDAVHVLKAEDHYLVWLLTCAGERTQGDRPKGGLLQLVGLGAAVVFVALAAFVIYRYANWN